MSRVIRLGTRGSALALAQSGQIAGELRNLEVDVVLVPLLTPGDLDSRPLAGRAHEGIFASSVRTSLREGDIDVAVHSFKDLPTGDPDAIAVGAVPRREDPRDALITRGHTIESLPLGARVGTCSARRAAWVRRTRPDLDVVPIRGNIDNRIARVVDGEFDAIVLAAAGINRLGIAPPHQMLIAVDDLVPAPAQGALAIECRANDSEMRALLAPLDDPATRLAAVAERAVLESVDPSDGTPVGAAATLDGARLHLIADICDADGSARIVLHETTAVDSARELGLRVGRDLLASRRPSLVS